MKQKREYRNFLEQVNANVKDLILFNNAPSLDEELNHDVINKQYEHYSNKSLKELSEYYLNYTVGELEKMEEDEFYELIHELASESLDFIYQWYLVTLYDENDTEEHERLNIVYSHELDQYFMPVFHFGTAWTHVSAAG